MIKMTCCFCGEEMKMENGAGHSCETTYSPAKTLTDEEIAKVYIETQGLDLIENSPAKINMFTFARAILRKAQKK